MKSKKCKFCSQEFQGKRSDAVYCSDKCRKANYRLRTGAINQFNMTCIICKIGVLYYPVGSDNLKCNHCNSIWNLKNRVGVSE